MTEKPDAGAQAPANEEVMTDQQIWDENPAETPDAEPKADEPDNNKQPLEAAVEADEAAKDAAQDKTDAEPVSEEKPVKPDVKSYEDMDRAQLVNAARSADGRVAHLQREMSKNQTGQVPKLDPTKLADMPEVAELLQAHLEQAIAPMQQEMAQLRQINAAQAEAYNQRQTAEQAEQTSTLNAEHPDYAAFLSTNGQQFSAFLNSPETSQGIVAAFKENEHGIVNAASASRLMTAFKSYLGEPVTASEPEPQQEAANPQAARRRERQLSASQAAPKANIAPVTTAIPADGDPEAIWNALS